MRIKISRIKKKYMYTTYSLKLMEIWQNNLNHYLQNNLNPILQNDFKYFYKMILNFSKMI